MIKGQTCCYLPSGWLSLLAWELRLGVCLWRISKSLFKREVYFIILFFKAVKACRTQVRRSLDSAFTLWGSDRWYISLLGLPQALSGLHNINFLSFGGRKSEIKVAGRFGFFQSVIWHVDGCVPLVSSHGLPVSVHVLISSYKDSGPTLNESLLMWPRFTLITVQKVLSKVLSIRTSTYEFGGRGTQFSPIMVAVQELRSVIFFKVLCFSREERLMVLSNKELGKI